MTINILAETPVLISKVPDWVAEHIGFRPNRSTVFRWTKRGSGGRKLSTFKAGGRRATTVEALLRFFAGDDETPDTGPINSGQSHDAAEAYLHSEGI